jgi:hypothetical protein
VLFAEGTPMPTSRMSSMSAGLVDGILARVAAQRADLVVVEHVLA